MNLFGVVGSLTVVVPRAITIGDNVTEFSFVYLRRPFSSFRGVAGDAIEKSAKHLRSSESHVLECLVDKKLVQSKLVSRDVDEASRFGLSNVR